VPRRLEDCLCRVEDGISCLLDEESAVAGGGFLLTPVLWEVDFLPICFYLGGVNLNFVRNRRSILT